ncbi:MAG: 1-deoxy-D-xylulose-5-phosphate reductoisomerase [Chloroflexota bacterium]|nr:1-deoxy-D-xylulose-5-phosphate reductoisomerase [Chloroflexota bacterium]
MKRIALLGATGSIGRQTLDVVRSLPHEFDIIALTAGSNIELLVKQIQEFRPAMFSFDDSVSCRRKWERLGIDGPEFLSPEEICRHPDVDLVLIATSGKMGLIPTLSSIKSRKPVALSNKEVLVMAGEIIMSEADKYGTNILPVDSEHSAIWQCIRGEEDNAVSRLILTASGGPFRDYSSAELERVSADEALRHPTWQMGRKVTVDSATLMNKGMEAIEAHWLFDVPFNDIQVIIHRESIIHSLVEFVDCSVKAQLSLPDMHLPIQYALSYPKRLANPHVNRLEWSTLNCLNFQSPCMDRFPCLGLALHAAKLGGTYTTVVSAADEVAVDRFLAGDIGFMDIPRLLEDTLENHQTMSSTSLDDILEADSWAREYAWNWRLK